MAAQQSHTTPFEVLNRIQQHLQQPANQRLLDRARGLIDACRIGLDRAEGNSQPSMKGLLRAFGLLLTGNDGLNTVKIEWDDRLLDDEDAFGSTTPWDDGSVTIRLEPESLWLDSEREERFGGSRADSVLSTLLHESIHAVLRIKACGLGNCQQQQCLDSWEAEVGEGGHGDAFCRIAALAQAFVLEHGLWACDLSLIAMAEANFHDTGRILDDATVELCWPGKMLKEFDEGLVVF